MYTEFAKQIKLKIDTRKISSLSNEEFTQLIESLKTNEELKNSTEISFEINENISLDRFTKLLFTLTKMKNLSHIRIGLDMTGIAPLNLVQPLVNFLACFKKMDNIEIHIRNIDPDFIKEFSKKALAGIPYVSRSFVSVAGTDNNNIRDFAAFSKRFYLDKIKSIQTLVRFEALMSLYREKKYLIFFDAENENVGFVFNGLNKLPPELWLMIFCNVVGYGLDKVETPHVPCLLNAEKFILNKFKEARAKALTQYVEDMHFKREPQSFYKL